MEITQRVRVYQSKDDCVRIIDVGTMVTHHNDGEDTLKTVYIGFLIPLWIELQHIERPSED